jgi:hypothetical protein
MLKLAEPGQNTGGIWIKPDERILQAGEDKQLLDRKQKIAESLNCRRKIHLWRRIMDIHHADVRHCDDGTQLPVRQIKTRLQKRNIFFSVCFGNGSLFLHTG